MLYNILSYEVHISVYLCVSKYLLVDYYQHRIYPKAFTCPI